MNLKYYNYIQYNDKPITYFHSSNIIKYNFKYVIRSIYRFPMNESHTWLIYT